MAQKTDGQRTSDETQKLTKALEDLGHFTESIVEIVQDGLIAVDGKGKVHYFNKAAQDILGYDRKRVIGRNIDNILSHEDAERILEGGFRAGEARVGKETTVKKLSGDTVSIGTSATVYTDSAGNVQGHIITFKDLTEIHRMQEEILRMDRLASLGEISSGIAHEIRNPLAAIKTTAQAMEEEMEPEDPKREFLSRIVKEIDRLDTMLRTFFSFAKPKRPTYVRCDIRDVVKEVLLLIGKDVKNKRIEIIEKYAPDLPAVHGDFQQLQQVFLNLLLNSVEFMDPDREKKIFITAWEKKNTHKKRILEVSLTDTGVGIDDEHINKIFDPFFTTTAKGTGLGLSITYRIVQRHGGSIAVNSKTGQGTTFIINLPTID
jgi:two-component system, NtrC family, sensor histidine kinase AtoS